jgi:hypothetical protein
LFFNDFFKSSEDIFTFLRHLPNDYTMRFSEGYAGGWPLSLRWGNPLITLFITQRSILFGMPLALILLTYIWNLFDGESGGKGDGENKERTVYASFFVGVLAGFLPLIHAHSLLVVFFVAGFAAILTLKKWKQWLAFFIGAGLIAAPELLWAMSGSATRPKEFIAWHFGWDSGKMNIFAFWIANTGLFIPLLLTAIVLILLDLYREKDKPFIPRAEAKKLLLFYIPFGLCFVISNVAKLAPWEWDNIKVLIYWFVGSLPLVALLLARVWEMGKWPRALAAGAFAILIFAGALDVWRAASGSQYYQIAGVDEMRLADDIKKVAAPRALFLNAPVYNSPVGLSGRRSLMRYSGHLNSHGIDYTERESDVKKMYTASPVAETLLRKYNIEYVLIGPDERNELKAKEEFFTRFPVVAEEGPYRVYKIK